MRKKTVSGMTLLIGMLTLAFNVQQPQITAEAMVEGASIPPFVAENKFVYESSASFEWLDPHVSYYSFDYWILQQTVETLLWFNGSSSTNVIPWLAESYSKNLAGTQYTFKLRRGIRFQDGTPLNSTSVWFSLNRLLIMDGTSGDGMVHGSQAAWIIQQLLDTSLSNYFSGDQPYDSAWVKKVLDQNFVEIVDAFNFRMNVKNPMPLQFPYLLSGPWASIISPTSVIKKDYEYHGWGTWDGNYTKYFEHMAGVGDTYFNVPEQGWKIGTGPYYMQSVDTDTYRVVLMAHEGYWGAPPNIEYPVGKPKIKSIKYLYQPDFDTRLENLKTKNVTGISVSPFDLYAVADQDKWLDEGILQSTIPNATIHGPYAQLTTVWFNFCTNVTDAAGLFKKFQPMADIRFREAIASSVNMTDMNINTNNKLGVVAQNLIPPGTAPKGAYNASNTPFYSYNLTRVEELLVDVWLHPLKSSTHELTFYNGTRIPADVVDNSFSEANPQTVEIYVPIGATHYEKVSLTIAENLNTITMRRYNPVTGEPDPEGEKLGLIFSVVPVPPGQQYTLASLHQIYMYWGGWIADYNHVMNWLGPMYRSTGTYFSWNLWNVTSLDSLYWKALEAESLGDVAQLLDINNQMNRIVNDMVLYLWLWHPMTFFVRSSFLKGWYYNSALCGEYLASMYYADTIVVSIYTDKYTYHAGDVMRLGLNIFNPDSAKEVCFAIWLTLPDNSNYLYMHKHSVVLPIGFEYGNPNFQKITMPSLPSGTYTWHAAFLERTTHTIIVEDTAEWAFT